MKRKLVITLVGLPEDISYLKDQIVPPVEEAVAEAKDDGRLDGEVAVDWDWTDLS
jgi:hypothetical protein